MLSAFCRTYVSLFVGLFVVLFAARFGGGGEGAPGCAVAVAPPGAPSSDPDLEMCNGRCTAWRPLLGPRSGPLPKPFRVFLSPPGALLRALAPGPPLSRLFWAFRWPSLPILRALPPNPEMCNGRCTSWRPVSPPARDPPRAAPGPRGAPVDSLGGPPQPTQIPAVPLSTPQLR